MRGRQAFTEISENSDLGHVDSGSETEARGVCDAGEERATPIGIDVGIL